MEKEKQFYVGAIVAYQQEKKEWQITKGELTDKGVVYTIKKIDGREVGKVEKVYGGLLE